MKSIIKIILLALFVLSVNDIASAGLFPIDVGLDEVKDSSMDVSTDENVEKNILKLGKTILGILKLILSSVIIFFLVYAGTNMVLSMGSDDEKLSTSKRQIWYSVIGLLFINIPGTLYESFKNTGGEINESGIDVETFNAEGQGGNFFVNAPIFENVFYNQIVRFIEITILGLAVMVIILAGFQIILARGKEEKVTEARNKILYSMLALFFVGFIEGLKRVVYGGNTVDATGIFSAISNLILFFAAPVAIVFLFVAAFYFITSGGNEDRVKKAKSIVVNTFLATILIMAIYTFLLDLSTLTI